ncbi:hypothetical protein HYS54_01635 [Candidatus Micrarchaeota archaeon]|nr:hypothetical protein [Candidatus Micrarchaeota archaeon]
MVEKLHSEAKRALGVEEVSARALGISEGMLRHGVADKIWGAGIAAAARKMAREVKNPDAMWDYISERWAGKQPNDAWEAVLKKYRR